MKSLRYLLCRFIAPVLTCAWLMIFATADALAQDASAERRRANQLLSPSVFRVVSKAREAMDQSAYDEAQSLLTELLTNESRLSEFEQATAHQLLVYVYVNQDDYATAIVHSEKAIALAALDIYTELELRYNLAQLYAVMEDYRNSVQHLELWFSQAENPGASAYFTAAQIHAATEDFNKALHYALQGMDKHRSDASDARESWYRLLLAIRLQLKHYDEAVPLLETMLRHWPDQAEYFQQLSALYAELEKHRESLAALAIAHHNNLLRDESDFKRLNALYRFNDHPYRGAMILQAAMEREDVSATAKHWEALANTWLQAREWQRSDEALQHAAGLSEDGRIFELLCQTAMQQERWHDAQRYCRSAIDKGKLGEAASVWQMLALSLYYQDEILLAAEAFQQCAQLEKQQTTCQDWWEHLQTDKPR